MEAIALWPLLALRFLLDLIHLSRIEAEQIVEKYAGRAKVLKMIS
jgi:hypothetical protein